MDIKQYIASIPGFPKEGIIFRDVTPILKNPDCMKYVTEKLSAFAKEVKADLIIAPEARGFFFGIPVALNVMLVLRRYENPVSCQGKQCHSHISWNMVWMSCKCMLMPFKKECVLSSLMIY